MRKILSILIILGLILSTFTLSFAEVLKDETIYVNLDHSGTTRDIKVVNRIYGESNEKYYLDYGEYENIVPLVDIEPIVEEGKIKWPLEHLKDKDIYYEANIDKELPIKIDMKYFLDGKEILGDELAGKSGNLKINISIENESNLTT
ncbi:MAG: hypothetical protein GX968_01685, partial [Tissierellia bacterium]|nr:hypothetical protein [Tissierellia bacterium]